MDCGYFTDREEFGARQGAPSFSAFGSGGDIELLLAPTSAAAFAEAVRALRLGGERFEVLGRATNVLFPDCRTEGAVLSTGGLRGEEVRGGTVWLAAGEKLGAAAQRAQKRGLSGLENIASVPGSIGGAIAMNAGAYGREICELVEYVDVLSDGKTARLSPRECGFGYRSSVFGKDTIVIGAALKLVQASPYDVAESMREFKRRRTASQPSGRSLGSVFRRAEGTSAGWFVERAGFKGARAGGAEVSRKHANFIVNRGGATSADFVELMERVRDGVKAYCGTELVPEVVILRGSQILH